MVNTGGLLWNIRMGKAVDVVSADEERAWCDIDGRGVELWYVRVEKGLLCYLRLGRTLILVCTNGESGYCVIYGWGVAHPGPAPIPH